MKRTVVIKEDVRKTCAALFLLQKIKSGANYNVLLTGDDQYLEPIFELLMSHEKIAIADNTYTLTELGEKTLNLFRKRYTDFLRNFDVYSAVDLQDGTFAFEKYWQINDENEWESYLEQENWEDLRIAVCEYKNIDPVQMVFLSFINEGRLKEKTETENGWQFDLVVGSLWDEAAEIISSAITKDDLAYTDENQNFISGETVLLDIIRQGSELNRVLWSEEDKTLTNDDPLTLPTDKENYNRYRDPNYKSPEWDEPLF